MNSIGDLFPSLDLLLAPDPCSERPLCPLRLNKRTLAQDQSEASSSSLSVVLPKSSPKKKKEEEEGCQLRSAHVVALELELNLLPPSLPLFLTRDSQVPLVRQSISLGTIRIFLRVWTRSVSSQRSHDNSVSKDEIWGEGERRVERPGGGERSVVGSSHSWRDFG